MHTRPNSSLLTVISYVDSDASPYPSASEKLKAPDPQDVFPRGKKQERVKVMCPIAGDESSSSNAKSTSAHSTLSTTKV